MIREDADGDGHAMDPFWSLAWKGGPLVGSEIDLGTAEGEFSAAVLCRVKGEIERHGAFFGVPVRYPGSEVFVEVVPGDVGEVELEVLWVWLEGKGAEWWWGGFGCHGDGGGECCVDLIGGGCQAVSAVDIRGN